MSTRDLVDQVFSKKGRPQHLLSEDQVKLSRKWFGFLKGLGLDINGSHEDWQWSWLGTACASGDLAIIHVLLCNGADVNFRKKGEDSLIHLIFMQEFLNDFDLVIAIVFLLKAECEYVKGDQIGSPGVLNWIPSPQNNFVYCLKADSSRRGDFGSFPKRTSRRWRRKLIQLFSPTAIMAIGLSPNFGATARSFYPKEILLSYCICGPTSYWTTSQWLRHGGFTPRELYP
jgi:hypothetical protein